MAATHARTRRDHAEETAQDVCEAILTLLEEEGRARNVDLARTLGVSPVTITKTVTRLARDGWVTAKPYQPLALTEAGERLARLARARHRLVLDFLAWLGVPDEVAQADAEGMEHHLSQTTLDAMRAKMNA